MSTTSPATTSTCPQSAHCKGLVTRDRVPRTELHSSSQVPLPSKRGRFPALGTQHAGLGGRWTHRQRQRHRGDDQSFPSQQLPLGR